MMRSEVVNLKYFTGDIGYAIQSFVEKKLFEVVRDFCGHGFRKVSMTNQVFSFWKI